MARTKELTREQVIKALEEANGIQAAAARQLKVSRKTISNYIKNDSEIAEAYESVNEATIDKVENSLMGAIGKGNVVAMIFYLKTKAKHRGYVERQELTGKDGENLAPQISDDDRRARMKDLAVTIAEEVKKNAG